MDWSKFKFSYSSVATFKQCPLRFKLQYIDRLPTIQTEPLIKGNAVHEMVEELINDLSKHKEITIDISKYKYKNELRNFFELEELRQSKFTNKDKYFENVCEEKIDDPDYQFIGKLDRIYNFWDKGKVLLDYKTGKVRDKEKYYPQLALYVYMYNKKHPDSPITHWEIDWLTDSKKYFIEPINNTIITKEVKSYTETIERIKNETKFEEHITPLCLWCNVLYACPHKEEILKKHKYIADRKGYDVIDMVNKSIINRNKKENRKDKLVVYSKVAGTTFNNINAFNIHKNDTIVAIREPNNEFDKNAIRLEYNNIKIGYIKKTLARDMAKGMDNGVKYNVYVENITGGTKNKENKGINIRIEVVK